MDDITSFIKDERSARLLFCLIPEMGPLRFQRLFNRFGSALAALQAPEEDWAQVEDIAPSLGRRMRRAGREARKNFEEERALLHKAGARFLIPSDPEFPEGLKSLPDAPIALFVRGDYRPVDSLGVALVGTRHPTPYGREAAEKIARELAQAGVTVVSGLARGIDTAAHAAALKGGGRTIGVLGGGLNEFYPPENKALAEKMAAQGAVISEFSMRMTPIPGNFPQRNRLIAGLSLAVVVIEADKVSGALITARLAAEQGRDVFAVPGSIFSKMSLGPHRLLKQGAKPVEGAEDILEEIEVFRNLARRPSPPASVPGAALSSLEEKLMVNLSLEPAGVDALSVRSGLPAASVSSTLLMLELKGLVKALPGKCYVRSGNALEQSASN